MLSAVLTPFVMAALTPACTRPLGKAAAYVYALAPLAVFGYLLSLIPAAHGEPATVALSWVPSLGVGLSFYGDALALSFALLISGIGVLIVLYAGAYLGDHPLLGRFYCYLFLFMGAMLGAVLAGNIITLFVFWELTSISSYLLIGFERERKAARDAALQALLVTGAGGLALLAGLVLLGQAAGTYDLRYILEAQNLHEHPFYTAAVVLILAGAFTKSAQFPFHFWLPGAMQAPAPVSAYLHSSTMVKAGLYLVARLNPVLGGGALWAWAVVGFGAVTMLAAAYLAYRQTKMKPLLAYTTVSALATILVCFGLGTPWFAQDAWEGAAGYALKAALVFLFVHAFYKATLFMVAGALEHETGEKDAEKLGGLARAMPWTCAAGGIAALSMAGIPPLVGFIGKETVYEAGLQAPVWAITLTTVFVIANVLNVYAALLVGVKPFWTRRQETPKAPHEGPFGLWAGGLLLGALGLLFGLLPGVLGQGLIEPAAAAVAGAEVKVHLKLWHGVNTAFILSLVTLGAGALLYLLRRWLRPLFEAFGALDPIGPAAGYEAALSGVQAGAAWQTRRLQHGYLRYYLFVIACFALALPAGTLFLTADLHVPAGGASAGIAQWVVAGALVAAALGATLTGSRLAAVIYLGVVGFSVSLVFVMYGAPDLAMTQMVVETLTVLLFIFVLHRMPRFSVLTDAATRVRDAALAVLFGGFMTVLIIAAQGVEIADPISGYFVENSVDKAFGRNFVNTILVDFRALDTLGELTVLAVAALGAFGLLRLRIGGAGKHGRVAHPEDLRAAGEAAAAAVQHLPLAGRP